MLSDCVATVRADTSNTQGSCSAAILYILGIISKRPCEAVNVVVRAPAASEPCTVPAAPASDCISVTFTVLPKYSFFLLLTTGQQHPHWVEGVIG